MQEVKFFEKTHLEKLNSNQPALTDAFHRFSKKYIEIDENNCYVDFPLEAFKSEEFIRQFDIGLISVLNRYGLECKFQTPPFKSIREFLNIKFNYDKDDVDEINPLKTIDSNLN